MREKERFKEQDKLTNTYFDNQSLHLHDKLKEAQESHKADRLAMMKAMQEENQQLAKQKRDKDVKERMDELYQE